ncbi:CU044_5270 family protein [Streptomyces sp. NPDC006365]|uniref:CU044_5270 family protein n=1 Tax=Streptomyces sp. NPDC006365 TaxID=3364744 RepID=UPI00368D4942
MEDMTRVRELRAEAPVPDRGRLAPGRGRLVEAAKAGQRPGNVRRRRVFVIAAVVAAVTAVAFTVSFLVEGSGSGRKVQPAASPSMSLKGLSAAEFLERAADVVEQEPPATEPRAKQWIYTKSRQEARGRNAKVMVPVEEEWIQYDGTLAAQEERGKLLTHENPNPSPREAYRFLTALPTDGEQVLEAVRDAYDDESRTDVTRTQRDYGEIRGLLNAHLVPPDGLAGLYRALATLPGGKVVDHLVKTADGRRVIALRYESPYKDGPTDEWLLDPETRRIVGLRQLDGHDKPAFGTSIVTRAVVDEAGQRS